MNIRKKIEKDLVSLNRPARYIGNEWGATHKDWTRNPLRIALAFPDLYEVGMSHFGSRIIYDRFNRLGGVLAERVFAPDSDLEGLLRERQLPLFSLESGRSLGDFDAIAFSLSYELTYTNLLNMLDLAGIPLLREERTDCKTIVFAGGPSCNNPEPLSDFLDFFAIGDGEEMSEAIAGVLARHLPKAEALELLSGIEGIYVPSLENRTRKRVISALLPEQHPLCGPVSYLPIVHERVSIEVRRGCDRGCRFCQAGSLYLPVRERPVEDAVALTKQSLALTGYEEFSLFSLSSSDYSAAPEVASRLLFDCSKDGVSMSLPSMRVDSFSQELVKHQVRRSTLTFAPEAGSQRLRDVINKGVDEQEILDSISAAYEAGWNEIKLYFMIGLPTETEEDLSAIAELVATIKRRAQAIRRADKKPRPAIRINVTVSTFVPKPHTPFQWRRQDTPEEIRAKQRFLVDKLRAQGVATSYHDPLVSELECAISRGDASVGKTIRRAWELGCRHDAWREHFKPQLWALAAQETGLDFERFAHRTWDYAETLPWDRIDSGLSKSYLQSEDERASIAALSSPCTEECRGCGLCQSFGLQHRMADSPKKEKPESERSPLPTKAVRKLRARFRKEGDLRFISHLDLMRLFERATKRAQLPLTYSQGFNPRPAIAFASALALGTTSEAEWVDLTLAEALVPSEVLERLNRQLPEGCALLEINEVPLNASSLMALIDRAVYRVTAEGLPEDWTDFLLEESLVITRKNDKGEKRVEIRPFIYSMKAFPGGVEIEVATGSRGSVKAEEVIRAYADWAKKESRENRENREIRVLSIHRKALSFLEQKEKTPC